MVQKLTDRQAQILAYLYQHLQENAYIPSYREIAEEFGINSTKAVSDHLQALERRGYIKREKRKSRAIQILELPPQIPVAKISSFPQSAMQPKSQTAGTGTRKKAAARVVEIQIEQPVTLIEGAAIAANPAGATDFGDYPLEQLPVDTSLFGGGPCFALRVQGDSMEGAHICDGDLAIIREQQTVRDGDIAAVELDGEVTLKYFKLQGRNVMLTSANARYQPRLVDTTEQAVRIMGKFVGIIRQSR